LDTTIYLGKRKHIGCKTNLLKRFGVQIFYKKSEKKVKKYLTFVIKTSIL
jgi:hypothetical protein